MEIEEFNKLLKEYHTDKNSATELCRYCLANIKRRVFSLYRNIYDAEDLARDILANFIRFLPKHYVFAPMKYLNKVTDNYIKKHYSNYEEILPISVNFSYEQNFEKLEKSEVMILLKKYLCKSAAEAVYLKVIEAMPETKIAKRLNLSYGYVRVLLCQSMKTLKEELGGVTNKNK